MMIKRLVGITLLFAVTFICSAHAQHMLKKENYLTNDVCYIGLPDFPPFSYYDTSKQVGDYKIDGAFIKPVLASMEKYGFAMKPCKRAKKDSIDLQQLTLDLQSGEAQVFIGAYSDTKLFRGFDLIYPAVVSNPVHVITLPDVQDKIKKGNDLKNLRGVVSKSEYFSDFVLRKFKSLNITYVDTPFEAYEKIFVGDADYMLGSLYYNRIMASRYGIEQYLSYSKTPLFKIPVFLALTRQMSLESQYMKAFQTEFSKPEFATEIKKEIIRLVEEEIEKNMGIVPPAFAKKVVQTEATAAEQDEAAEERTSGSKILEKEVQQKTIDEVLDGI